MISILNRKGALNGMIQGKDDEERIG